MNSDLQHLIHLQELDLSAERLRRRIADIPGAQDALDTRVASAAAAASTLRDQISANQAARRDIEKDLATVQARLSKYKDQLMEVKTNKEYQAMQHEIAAAEQNVRAQEDRLLERMVEADTLAAELAAHVDDVAERVTALGGLAMGTARMAAAHSALPELDIELTAGRDFVKALAERYGMAANSTRHAIDATQNDGDANTADLFTEISRALDKRLWFLEAHLTE